MRKKILIIGSGIHGLTAGISLAKAGFKVTIIDKNPGILQGTSGATHNRAHLGYHYPRSISTGKECIKGLKHLKKNYPNTISYQDHSYYMIEKTSKTSLKEYEIFCKKLNIPYKEEWPNDKFIKRDFLQGGILTNEPVFATKKLKKILKSNLNTYNIHLINSANLIDFKQNKNKFILIANKNEEKISFNADIVLNATYAYSNNILKILDLEEDLTLYRLQHTEVVVVKSSKKLPSITIMDGPFISIMKYEGVKNHYLIYDAKNSVVEEKEGYFLKEKTFDSNAAKMLKHLDKYVPFVDNLKYVESWWGTRPILVKTKGDARNTRIKSHKKYPGIYSILEGKFISATLIADQFVSLLKEKYNG